MHPDAFFVSLCVLIIYFSYAGRKRHLGYWVTKVVFTVLPQMICRPIVFDTTFLYYPIRAI